MDEKYVEKVQHAAMIKNKQTNKLELERNRLNLIKNIYGKTHS